MDCESHAFPSRSATISPGSTAAGGLQQFYAAAFRRRAAGAKVPRRVDRMWLHTDPRSLLNSLGLAAGLENIHIRYEIHLAGFNLESIIPLLTGLGKHQVSFVPTLLRGALHSWTLWRPDRRNVHGNRQSIGSIRAVAEARSSQLKVRVPNGGLDH